MVGLCQLVIFLVKRLFEEGYVTYKLMQYMATGKFYHIPFSGHDTKSPERTFSGDVFIDNSILAFLNNLEGLGA